MSNKTTVKFTAVLLVLVCAGTSQGRVVLSKEKQEELINTARLLLGSPSEAKKTIPDDLHDPFHIAVEEVVVEEPVEEQVAEVVVAVEETTDLSEAEILDLVADRLRPSGFIDQGGQQYLILNGRKVQDGVVFNFPYEERRYAIEISRIQTNSFTLNLNSESKTIAME